MTEIHRYSSRSEWARAVAGRLGLEIGRALSNADTALVALAGGKTPGAILPLLNLEAHVWPRLIFVPTDDRVAPPGHEARNGERLLGWLKAAAGACEVRFVALEECDPLRAPDVALLGFGADRHIASLFPAGEGMASACAMDGAALRARVTPDPLPPEAPFARVTLTMRALTSASHVILAATGADKSAALDAAFAEAPPRSPLALLLAQQRAPVSAYLCTASQP